MTISMKDKNNQVIRFGDSLKICLDGNEMAHSNSNAVLEIATGLSKEAFSKRNLLQIDMTEMVLNEFLPLGENQIVIDYYMGKDSILEEKLESYTITLRLENFPNESLASNVKPESGKTESELLQIRKNTDNIRKIKIDYISEGEDAYVEIKLQKKAGTTSSAGIDEFTTVTNSVTINQISSIATS